MLPQKQLPAYLWLQVSRKTLEAQQLPPHPPPPLTQLKLQPLCGLGVCSPTEAGRDRRRCSSANAMAHKIRCGKMQRGRHGAHLIKVAESLDGEALVGWCQHRELRLVVPQHRREARILHGQRPRSGTAREPALPHGAALRPHNVYPSPCGVPVRSWYLPTRRLRLLQVAIRLVAPQATRVRVPFHGLVRK